MKQKCFISKIFSYICHNKQFYVKLKLVEIMKIFAQSGNSMRDLTDFINANGIEKDQIVSIGQNNDGVFMLVYYSND